MNIEEFWKIVDTAFCESKESVEGRVGCLKTVLSSSSEDDLQSFQSHYDAVIKKAYTWDLWGAAYIINGGCSDDGFRYFLDWLISGGSKLYDSALNDPESLADLPQVEDAENESYGYIALEVFEERGFGEIERDFSVELSMPAGEEWEEEQLGELFPKLSKIYEY